MSDPVDATTSTTALPTGTVTFVMTDIEGSTRLIQALGDLYPQLLAEHYGLLREAFSTAGVEVGSQGDALFTPLLTHHLRCGLHWTLNVGCLSTGGRPMWWCGCGWGSTAAKGGC
jgi:class 3 adenylate cyclase